MLRPSPPDRRSDPAKSISSTMAAAKGKGMKSMEGITQSQQNPHYARPSR